MSGLFRWCMRHGAKLLLAIAAVQILIGLLPVFGAFLSTTREMAGDHSYSPDVTGTPMGMELQMLWSMIAGAVWPLFGALVIDRLDRWLAIKDREAGR